jgi:tRNA1Val (adenine37-N6)-methyltransferase
MAFRFKQFTVEDDQSTMRVGTDAVLLGAWAEVENAGSVLEIGTGCGIIAMMIAQRSPASILAIDLDEPSIRQAALNFDRSPWSTNLKAVHSSLQDFTPSGKRSFDLILSNPPFFERSLRSPDVTRNMARHDAGLTHRELLDGVHTLLKEEGIFSLILPEETSTKFSDLASQSGLFIRRQMRVWPKQGKPAHRVLSSYGYKPSPERSREELTIRNEDGTFTNEYIAFTGAYYFSPG